MGGCSGIVALVVTTTLIAQQAQPPAVIRVEVVEGEGAINNIAERRARDPVVRVVDDDNRPIAGANVTFVTPELGATAIFPSGHIITVTTDGSGIATGVGLRPNNVAGEFQIRVTASYRGQSATAAITQTNAAPAAARKSRGGVIALLVALAGGGAGAAFALSKRSSSSPSPPPGTTTPSGTTIAPGAGTFGPP
ncbi:MAG: hypothetical protein ACRD44_04840 [Bryobacteraceae bacterium]